MELHVDVRYYVRTIRPCITDVSRRCVPKTCPEDVSRNHLIIYRLIILMRTQFLFKFLLTLTLLSLGVYIFFRVDMYLTDRSIANQEAVLAQQNDQLDQYMSLTGYEKIMGIKQLEETVKTMPRFQQIPKVIAILDSIKAVDTSENESIILSDFKVSLEEISVKGKVSSLKLLYYTSPSGSYVSLFDKFASLDFIKDIKIKTYDKVGDYFEFLLTANVITDGKTTN
jgi:hypothetical protein